MPSPRECSVRFKKGSKEYKDCIQYKSKKRSKVKESIKKGVKHVAHHLGEGFKNMANPYKRAQMRTPSPIKSKKK